MIKGIIAAAVLAVTASCATTTAQAPTVEKPKSDFVVYHKGHGETCDPNKCTIPVTVKAKTYYADVYYDAECQLATLIDEQRAMRFSSDLPSGNYRAVVNRGKSYKATGDDFIQKLKEVK